MTIINMLLFICFINIIVNEMLYKMVYTSQLVKQCQYNTYSELQNEEILIGKAIRMRKITYIPKLNSIFNRGMVCHHI